MRFSEALSQGRGRGPGIPLPASSSPLVPAESALRNQRLLTPGLLTSLLAPQPQPRSLNCYSVLFLKTPGSLSSSL